MAWFKVDDAFLMSSKVMSIPRSIRNEALGVWLQTAVWSAHEMKDGLIPAHVLDEFQCGVEIQQALVSSHLWVDAEKGSVLIHNWNKYQPTREELEAKRAEVSEARARSGRAGGMSSGATRRSKAEANAKQNEAKRTPEPEPEPEPEPLTLSKESVKRAHRIDPNFNVSAEMREWASREVPGLNLDKVTASFIDYWSAKAGKDAMKLDWVATWRNWLRRDHEALPVTSKPTATKTASDASYFCKQHGWPKDDCPRCAEVAA